MKKNKRHLYKRLPKYALGTMKPMDSGYQRGMIGSSAKFDTEQNMSLEPETQAIRKSALPNALGYIQQQTPYITEMLKSSTNASANTVANTANAITNTSNTMANFSTGIQSFTPTVLSPGASVQMTNGWTGGFNYHLGRDAVNALTSSANAGAGATLGSVGSNVTPTIGKNFAQNLFEHGAGKIGEQAVKESAKRAGTSTLGTAMGVVGTALGGYTMANQIAGFGDHRSASDMFANVGRQHITTDMGNSYTNYNGVNAGQELAYEKANARSKQLGFGMNAIGTGASLGGTIGSIVPGLGNALGAGIGAIGGLILGGLGSLFGWGDNSEEIERLTRLTNDNIAMYNRQQESVAKSKDVAAEFSDRQNIPAAADGKSAYSSMGSLKKYSVGKSYSIGPHGWSKEINSLGTGQEVIWDTDSRNPEGEIVPGNPKEGDVKPMSVDEYDPSVVISLQNPYHPIAKIIVKEQKKLNKIQANASGSKEQQELQIREAEKMKQINNEKMKAISMYNPANLKRNKYSNGKPYTDIEDYLFKPTELETNNSSSFGLNGVLKGLAMATPHMWGFLQNAANYRKDKYGDIRSYNPYVGDTLSERAINDLHRIRFNAQPYYNEARKQLNYANFNTSRNAGLGAGGIEMAKNANFLGYLDKMKDINSLANEFNAKHATTAAQLAAQVGQTNQARQIAGNTSWYQWLREAAAAKHANLRTDQLNMYKTFGQGVEDFAKSVYADRAAKMNERMMGMYGQQLTNDKIKLLHDLNMWNPTQTIPSLPKKSETELDENTLRYLREELAKQQLLKYGAS